MDYNTSIEELEVGIRAYKCLKDRGIEAVWEIAATADADFLKTKNFGRKSLKELRELMPFDPALAAVVQPCASSDEIALWCEQNLFGQREVQGIHLNLTPMQEAVKHIAVGIIMEWETRKRRERREKWEKLRWLR